MARGLDKFRRWQKRCSRNLTDNLKVGIGRLDQVGIVWSFPAQRSEVGERG